MPLEWKIPRKRDAGEMIFAFCRCIEPRNNAADPAFADFNNPLPPQDSPGTTGLAVVPSAQAFVTTENIDDIRDSRDALREPGERKEYEAFRRELGLD